MAGRAAVLFFLLGSSVLAQTNRRLPSLNLAWHVRVHLVVARGTSCDPTIQVALINGVGFPVTAGAVNRDCTVDFFQVAPGSYQLTVIGPSIQSSNLDVVLNPSGLTDIQDLEVKVRSSSSSDQTIGLPMSSFVSATDLGIPAGAAKEFGKANRLIEKQDWNKAIERLQKAIAIYPTFAAAYTNLGLMYSRIGDRARACDSLQKAIRINDHFVPAYVTLSRINIAANDFAGAETLLRKAAVFTPSDAMTLVLLAYVEVVQEHFDETIATSRQAHATTRGQHAFVHLAAARAFEQKRLISDSIAELRLYLSEDPASPQANEVRKAMATLESTYQVGEQKTP
jgi:tetratricopeptide repeat protein